MLDKSITREGTLLLMGGTIYLDGWEITDGGMCREVAALACLYVARRLQEQGLALIQKPGGDGRTVSDMPDDTPVEWLCPTTREFLDRFDKLPEGGGTNRTTDHAGSLHRSAGADPAHQSASPGVDPSGGGQSTRLRMRGTSMSERPTGRLRFVERPEPADWNADRSGKTGLLSMTRKIRVLQQEWEKYWGEDVGGIFWRDVPLELEHSAPAAESEEADDAVEVRYTLTLCRELWKNGLRLGEPDVLARGTPTNVETIGGVGTGVLRIVGDFGNKEAPNRQWVEYLEQRFRQRFR